MCLNFCVINFLLSVSLHQGRGGPVGPIGIIGPNGSAVCIVVSEISFDIFFDCCYSTDDWLCASFHRVPEERRAIAERLWVLIYVCLLCDKSRFHDNIQALNVSISFLNRDCKDQGYVCTALSYFLFLQVICFNVDTWSTTYKLMQHVCFFF